MELASTAAAVAETAEKVYEGTQDIRKVSNVTSEVKNVADSEGKDQLDATIGMASSRELSSSTFSQPESGGAFSDTRSDNAKPGIPEKSFDDSLPLDSASDNPLKGTTIFDEGIPAGADLQNHIKDATVFDEGIPLGAEHQNPIKDVSVFDEGIPAGADLQNHLKDATVFDEGIPAGSSLENSSKDANPALLEKSKNTEVPSESEMNKPIEEVDDPSSVSLEDDAVLADDEVEQNQSEVSEDTEPRRISTRNEGLVGTTHPVTGVPFEEKVVETDTGEKVVGVFPEFKSVFDAQLPKELYHETDAKQFEEAQRQLKAKYDSDPSFREQFSERARYDIENGNIPPYGYTWHHNEETGKMQLVDYDTHQKTGHTGGKTIWGGGSDNR